MKMTKFFVPPLFGLFLSSMFIGISKAGCLFENSNKFCNNCQKLAKSENFKDMISKLEGTIRIESRDLYLDENANVKYDLLLLTLKGFTDEVEKNKKVNGKFIIPKPNDTEENANKIADKFINQKHTVLKKKVGNKFLPIRSEFGDILVKAVKCAIGVDPSDPEQKNGKCIYPDVTFKRGLLKTLKLIEPPSLYQKCHTLPKSHRFTEMIGELSEKGKIPIDAKEDAALSPQGTLNYQANILAAIEKFLNDFINKRGIVDKVEEKEKRNSPLKRTHRFKGIEQLPFVYTHEVFKNTLEQECGIKEYDGLVTVESVLKEGLECAIKVHQFRQQIVAIENGADKKLPDAQKWADLDGEFWTGFKQIWRQSEMNMEDEAVEDTMHEDDSAKTED